MKRLNWSAISQVLAAMGVVVSLVFVGYQIRQNTAVARTAAAQAFTQQIIDLNAVIVSGNSPVLSAQLLTGAKRKDFTTEELFTLDTELVSLVRVWESLYRSVQAGIVDEELLMPMARRGQTPFFSPYFIESWKNYRTAFTDDFVAYFEASLPHLQ